MYRCNLCQFTSITKSSWAGHLSGHARRGEKIGHIDHPCHLCDAVYTSGAKLGAHITAKHVPKVERQWDQLTSNCQRKQRLLDERGRKCETCGITEWCNRPTPIELDHIDGNVEHNSKENLRLLCPNCHAQTPTYKGRNIGKHDTKNATYRREYRLRTKAPVA